MTNRDKNYNQAIGDVDERIREVTDLLLDAKDAMIRRDPHEAWRHLDDAKERLEGALVSARWAQSIYPREE